MLRLFSQRRPVAKTIAALFVLAIVASIGSMYWQAWEHRRLASEINRHGFYSEFSRSAGGYRNWLRNWREGRTSNRIVELRGPEVDDAWLREWNYLRAVSPTTLNLEDTSITADGLAVLIESKDQLWSLGLRHMPISDAVAAALREKSMLAYLDVTGSTLTDPQLAQLPLNRLTGLGVAQTAVTADGLLKQLPACAELTSIGIDGRQCDARTVDALIKLGRVSSVALFGGDVTDEDVERLAGLRLDSAVLVETAVTDEGVANLKTRHPRCLVHVMHDR